MKARDLPAVIRAFDPQCSLVGRELKDWYINRPSNPLERMKIYLQGLGLSNQPVKILFTGHVGSGKSTPKPANSVAKMGTTFHKSRRMTPPAIPRTAIG